MKNALVIFTKVPKAGETKTWLTEDRGGILTPGEAKELYEAFLLDVIDSCIASDSCDVYVCHNLGGDRNYLRKLLETLNKPQSIREIFTDEGGTFDHGMQYATDYIFKDGQARSLPTAF